MVRFIFRVAGGAVKGWTEVGTTAINVVLGKRRAGPGLTTQHCKQAATCGRLGGGAQHVDTQPAHPSWMAPTASVELPFPVPWRYKPTIGLAEFTNAQIVPKGSVALPVDSWYSVFYLCKPQVMGRQLGWGGLFLLVRWSFLVAPRPPFPPLPHGDMLLRLQESFLKAEGEGPTVSPLPVSCQWDTGAFWISSCPWTPARPGIVGS